MFEHISEFGAGWVPVGGHGLAEGVRRLREHVATAGRDPDTLEVIPFTSGVADHAKVDALANAGATDRVRYQRWGPEGMSMSAGPSLRRAR